VSRLSRQFASAAGRSVLTIYRAKKPLTGLGLGRPQFKTQMKEEIAVATGLQVSQIKVDDVQAGSINLFLTLLAKSDGKSPSEVRLHAVSR
jgi:hypothetical protein